MLGVQQTAAQGTCRDGGSRHSGSIRLGAGNAHLGPIRSAAQHPAGRHRLHRHACAAVCIGGRLCIYLHAQGRCCQTRATACRPAYLYTPESVRRPAHCWRPPASQTRLCCCLCMGALLHLPARARAFLSGTAMPHERLCALFGVPPTCGVRLVMHHTLRKSASL